MIFSSASALVIGHPEASGYCSQSERLLCGRTQEIFGAVSEDLLGGTGKAEDVKLPDAGIIPKLCPMESAETEAMHPIGFSRW
jgi:hypothetical protein